MEFSHDGQRMSVAEYLDLNENDPDHRYEYVDGEIYRRPDQYVRHALICSHAIYLLYDALQDDPRSVCNSQILIQLSETRYVYPDVTVSSHAWYDEEDEAQIIHDPYVVVEVVSTLTRERDQNIKAALYQECPTIQEFLLVDNKAPEVCLYRRGETNHWTIFTYDIDNDMELTSLNVRFPVAEFYRKTRFAKRLK